MAELKLASDEEIAQAQRTWRTRDRRRRREKAGARKILLEKGIQIMEEFQIEMTRQKLHESELETTPEKVARTDGVTLLGTSQFKLSVFESGPDVDSGENFEDCVSDCDAEGAKTTQTIVNKQKTDKLRRGVKVYTDKGVQYQDLTSRQYARLLHQGRLDEAPPWLRQRDELLKG